jgi:hypothetical protein
MEILSLSGRRIKKNSYLVAWSQAIPQASLVNWHYCENPVLHLADKPNSRGYNLATLFLEEINTGTWPSMLGESQK